MNDKEVVLSFYMFATNKQSRSRTTIRKKNEPVKSGWCRQVIYKDCPRQNHSDLGSYHDVGNIKFIKLSDGRVIVTNDLRGGGEDTTDDDHGSSWVSAVPDGALIGCILSTRVCQPKSIDALTCLMKLLNHTSSTSSVSSSLPLVVAEKSDDDDDGPIWKINGNLLSDRGAYYELCKKYGTTELPSTSCTSRQYKQDTNKGGSSAAVVSSSEFHSPENDAILVTHIKVGSSGAVEKFRGPKSFRHVDPSKTPVFVLYEEHHPTTGSAGNSTSTAGLQPGDTINETYVYKLPDWTGKLPVAGSATDSTDKKKEANGKKERSTGTSSSSYHRRRSYDDDHDGYDYNKYSHQYYDYSFDREEEPFTPYSGYYRTGDGDSVYCLQGEQPDFTACGSDCGYCGRCRY